VKNKCFLIAIFLVVSTGQLLADPAYSREGATWKTDELLKYLTANGFNCAVLSKNSSAGTDQYMLRYKKDVIMVTRMETADVAFMEEENSLFWGKFALQAGDKGTLRSIKEALKIKGAMTGADATIDKAGTASPRPQRSLVDLCKHGKAETIRQALKAGASVAERDQDGWTPLMQAAALNESADAIFLLVTAGASLSDRNKDGNTPLYLAAYFNSADVVSALLKAGAPVRSAEGTRALVGAILADQSPKIVSLLIKAGAPVNEHVQDDMTPLRAALVSGRGIAIVAPLLSAGASVTETDSSGWTPLMHAASSNEHAEVIGALVAAGASVNAAEKSVGMTPLMLAAGRNTPDVVMALLKAGADAGAKLDFGKNVLDFARDNPKLEGTSALTALRTAAGE
jgi:ankyrin repeat protein